MNYYLTEIKTNDEKNNLEAEGYFTYDVRDSDFGNEFSSIKKSVLINRSATIITNEPIAEVENMGFIDYEDFINDPFNYSCSSLNEVQKINKEKSNSIEL